MWRSSSSPLHSSILRRLQRRAWSRGRVEGPPAIRGGRWRRSVRWRAPGAARRPPARQDSRAAGRIVRGRSGGGRRGRPARRTGRTRPDGRRAGIVTEKAAVFAGSMGDARDTRLARSDDLSLHVERGHGHPDVSTAALGARISQSARGRPARLPDFSCVYSAAAVDAARAGRRVLRRIRRLGGGRLEDSPWETLASVTAHPRLRHVLRGARSLPRESADAPGSRWRAGRGRRRRVRGRLWPRDRSRRPEQKVPSRRSAALTPTSFPRRRVGPGIAMTVPPFRITTSAMPAAAVKRERGRQSGRVRVMAPSSSCSRRRTVAFCVHWSSSIPCGLNVSDYSPRGGPYRGSPRGAGPTSTSAESSAENRARDALRGPRADLEGIEKIARSARISTRRATAGVRGKLRAPPRATAATPPRPGHPRRGSPLPWSWEGMGKVTVPKGCRNSGRPRKASGAAAN